MLPTIDQLRQAVDDKLIRIDVLDDLILCNYTEKCQYDNIWTPLTEQCRGLILRVDRPWPDATQVVEVVALPFPKFWNLGENGRVPQAALVEATDKVDGSLGILFRHERQYRIATRGRFASEQAQWATEFLKRFDLSGLPESWTLLFEVIYPGNRVVVDYGVREDLVLIGVRDRHASGDLWFHEVREVARRFGFGTPEVYDFRDCADVVALARDLAPEREGWVLRFADGARFKVKGAQYLDVARFLANLSRERVLEAMIEGTLDNLLRGAPEEFRPQVEAWRDEIAGDLAAWVRRVQAEFELAPKGTRKDFALWVQQHCRADAPFLFKLLDAQPIEQLILKTMASSRPA